MNGGLGADSESRSSYVSIVPWARRLLLEGCSISEVMRAIYSVDLPAEAYAFQQAWSGGLQLDLNTVVHPWVLIALAEAPAQEVYIDDQWARRQEERAWRQWPGFLPLLQLGDEDAVHGGCLLGYDIDSLAEGKTTIWGIDGDFPEAPVEFRVLGNSLLTVLREWQSDCLRMIKYQFSSESNFGAGSVDEDDVERVAGGLRAIDALQRTATGLPSAEK